MSTCINYFRSGTVWARVDFASITGASVLYINSKSNRASGNINAKRFGLAQYSVIKTAQRRALLIVNGNIVDWHFFPPSFTLSESIEQTGMIFDGL